MTNLDMMDVIEDKCSLIKMIKLMDERMADDLVIDDCNDL